MQLDSLLEVADTRPGTPAQSMCRALVRSLNVPAFLHSGDRLLLANAALERLLGHSSQDWPRLGYADLATPQSRDQMQVYGARCLCDDPEPAAIEMTLLTASGDERYVELISRRIEIDGVPAVMSTCTDLSDMRHVQVSLLNTSQVLSQILDNDPVATFVIDAQHRITHWNRACEQLTGRDGWDMQGVVDKGEVFYGSARPMLCDLILDGAAPAELQSRYKSPVQTSKVIDSAVEVEDFFPNFGDGGRWLFFTAAPLKNAMGQVIGAIETLQDVTQRHRIEEELRLHRQQLELLVSERTSELDSKNRELIAFMENASVGILALSGGKVIRHNKKFTEMFMRSGETAVALDTREFFCNASDYADFERLSSPLLALGRPFQHDMTLCRQDGRTLWVQMIAYACNIDDPSAGAWWLLQDRSEVRRAQEQLESNYERLKETNRKLEDAQNQLLQSEKMASIGQLAAGVAHEINNPVGFVNSNLNSLKTYVDGLMRLVAQYEGLETRFDALERTRIAATKEEVDLAYMREDLPVLLRESTDGLTRVKRIVQDLKDFSRIDHSDWQEADINAGLDSTLNVVLNEVKYKAEVRKNYVTLPAVRCLAAQLNQVFMNFIVNAAHAIDGMGVITLSTGSTGDWVWVEVQDTGSGMSPEVQKRIFEPFYTTKPVGKGTGLGLSLSFSIVQRHRGVIRVRSEVGKGSAFRVWLPVRYEEGEEAPPLPAELSEV
jgi:two-component system NtrC family sensor kinase